MAHRDAAQLERKCMGSERDASHHDDAEIIESNGHVFNWRAHQAAGMVSVQADCTVAAALELLVAYAAQHECTVDQAASAVVERRLRFDKADQATPGTNNGDLSSASPPSRPRAAPRSPGGSRSA